MRRLAARYPPHRSNGLTLLLTATNWAQKASPRRPKLAKGEICKEVAVTCRSNGWIERKICNLQNPLCKGRRLLHWLTRCPAP